MPYRELPSGVFVLVDGTPAVTVDGHLSRWTRTGYTGKLRLPAGAATVITPPSTVAVLRAGYPTQIDDAAR